MRLSARKMTPLGPPVGSGRGMHASAANRTERIERKEVYECRKLVLPGLAFAALLTTRDI